MRNPLAFETEPFEFYSEVDEYEEESSKTLVTSPAPDHLYRIRKDDTLLHLAGKTYSVGVGIKRIHRAQLINRHPFNWRYHVAPSSGFNKRFFLEGIVSFLPRFSCNITDFNFPMQFPPKGSCFSLLFLPPDSDIWFRRPPEVVQPDTELCWAAAILSWSTAVQHKMQFLNLTEVIDFFRVLTIDIPLAHGTVTRQLVSKKGGLIRWPQEKEPSKRDDSSSELVPAGMHTVKALATKLGISFEFKDHTLTIKDVVAILKKSDGPVIVLKGARGLVGHSVVIFGVSEEDGFVGEMNPLPVPERPTGPALGILRTRWLPTFRGFANHKPRPDIEESWEDFFFLFKSK
ncbi:MAG TPA: hypothetical protein PLO50_13455 [Nitrospira sp.]|nr:hypothetical protein [Nitrospira sp.]